MVTRNSVEERDPEKMFDGHINRNLRLATSMIDMSKPYIYVNAIKQVEGVSHVFEISFVVNGCGSINKVFVERNGSRRNVATRGYCNHNLPDGVEQSVFKVRSGLRDEFTLGAEVDQDMAKS